MSKPVRDASLEPKKHLRLATAGVLINEIGQVLIAQRPEGKFMEGFWEFPGGKLEPKETPEDAMIREFQEEIGIFVESNDLRPFTFISHDYQDFHVLVTIYVCSKWQGGPTGHDGQRLEWVFPTEIESYKFLPANAEVVEELKKLDL
ncbi:MAG: 8-oxo-dGTP diphosphatase MutT [Alphaproteobacteria bacterium]|jgi:8-oxo-dGTP diphosphatase|nr:8-oxo-dGTP diphosphatase MutT [Alphaproteobacteria bacterium]MBT5390495.1 8-oxo-dGTP diphosphatase MutT [Alphaproteobacteria bacterium]MBT5540627.1 8-oxo-dGTP diphosphatase MutT [Alphaproteobacteria bacterium]MBT5654835.1 8-oxo-dGTP diphosphatase MutT [Alphaproteobacteria bacterium]